MILGYRGFMTPAPYPIRLAQVAASYLTRRTTLPTGPHPTLGPALASTNGDALAAYLQHDLAGAPGALRSSSSLECVRADWTDMMSDPATLSAIHTLQCPAVLAWAARGPLGLEPGLYSPARLAEAHLPADVRTLRLDSDHYGTLLDPASLDALADALLTLVAGPRSGRPIHIPVR